MFSCGSQRELERNGRSLTMDFGKVFLYILVGSAVIMAVDFALLFAWGLR